MGSTSNTLLRNSSLALAQALGRRLGLGNILDDPHQGPEAAVLVVEALAGEVAPEGGAVLSSVEPLQGNAVRFGLA